MAKKEKKKAKKEDSKPVEPAKQETREDIRYIVRIANKDLNGNKPIYKALSELKGASLRYGKIAAKKFEEETGNAYDTLLGKISEEQDKALEDIVLNPQNHGLPSWVYNRQKDPAEGIDKHLVMSDLDFSLRADRQRLGKMKSYRGLRLLWGLTVRGQRTKGTHRGLKRSVIGVEKKKAGKR